MPQGLPRVRRWTERRTFLLLVILALLWVGAKVHFYTRFGATNIDGYLQEHWPFWAAMASVACLLWLVEAIEQRRRR